MVLLLSQPLADIADLINDNINALERHTKTLQSQNLSIEDLKKNLYVPVMNIRCRELSKPTTVCTSKDCIEIYTVSYRYYFMLLLVSCYNFCYILGE